MPRARRWLLVLLAAAALLGVLGEVARRSLASHHVSGVVASRLEAAFGTPVQVDEADIGITGDSSLHGLKLFEKDAGTSDAPWAVIDEVKADVSALSALRGEAMPSRLDVHGMSVTLRFDRDGHLLTRLARPSGKPGAIPTVHLQGGQIVLRQEGRPELALQGLDGQLESDGDRLVLHGTATDSTWGTWSLEGASEHSSGRSTATLRTAGIHITQAMLDRLPFVPEKVWKQVQCEGDTPVEVHVDFDSSADQVHYRVSLEPTGTSVVVTSIDLHAEQAQGKVVIDDNIVRLRGVHGQAADGTLKTDADLDFHAKPNQLAFKVSAERLSLSKLPGHWHLPSRISGRLSGNADLLVTLLGGGKVRTSGDGQGQIDDARLGRVPVRRPIVLRLHSDGGRFHFVAPQPPSAAGARLPVPLLLWGIALQGQPAPAPESAAFLPGDLASWLGNGVLRSVEGLARAGTDLLGWLPETTERPAAPRAEPNYLDASLSLEDVELVQLLKGLGLKLPFPVSGRVSIQVQVSIPLDGAGDIKAYRLNGRGTSRHFTLSGLPFDDVQARVHYGRGVFQLDDLHGRIPMGTAAGTFTGTAAMQIVPQGDLTARLVLADIPLGGVLSLMPAGGPHVDGQFSGTVDAQAALARLGDLRAWQGSGKIERLRVDRFEVGTVAFHWESDGEHLRLSDVHSGLYQGDVTGSAVLPLRASAAGSIDLQFRKLDIGALTRALPVVPLRVEGQADGTLEGTIARAAPNGTHSLATKLDVTAPRLRVQGIPSERLRGSVDYHNGSVHYDFEGQTLGGRFRLDGQIPPAAPKPGEPPSEGQLQVVGIELEQLWKALGMKASLGPLGGSITFNVDFRHAGPDGWPVGKGTLVVRRLRWGSTTFARVLRGDVILAKGELRLGDLRARVGNGSLLAQVRVSFADAGRTRFAIHLTQVDASAVLAPWPALSGLLTGAVNLQVSGTLGANAYGGGDLFLAQGKLYGTDVSSWRLPFTWRFDSAGQTGQVLVYDTSAQVAHGTVFGRADIAWGLGTRLEGQLRFSGVDLPTLVRRFSTTTQVATGQVNGRIDFGGTDVRSLEDVTANLNASLRQTQAMQLPILQQLAPFLMPGQSSSLFQQGEVRARLVRGTIRVDRLSFTGNLLRLFLQGTMSLAGRLDLQATATTRRYGVNPHALRFLGIAVPTIGPVPLGVLLEATTYLSNRVVNLRVTGTVRNPVIRVEPLPLLTQEAFTFFINRAGVPLP
jgi:hypothetical protein